MDKKNLPDKVRKTKAKTVFTFRIDEDLLEKLKDSCKKQGVVAGKLIELLIEEYLKK